MSKKAAAALANLLTGLVLGVGLHWAWSQWVELRTFSDQVANFGRVRDVAVAVAVAVSNYSIDAGSYPQSLADAVQPDMLKDIWGHEIQYCWADNGFVVLSPGRDGRVDQPPPCQYLGRGSPVDSAPCYEINRDTIVTNAGLTKGCAK